MAEVESGFTGIVIGMWFSRYGSTHLAGEAVTIKDECSEFF